MSKEYKPLVKEQEEKEEKVTNFSNQPTPSSNSSDISEQQKPSNNFPSVFSKGAPSIMAYCIAKINLKLSKNWFPVVFLLVVMIYTGSKSLQFLTIPIYTIFKNLTIIFIAYGEVLWFKGSVTVLMMTSFLLMVFSSIIAASSSDSLNSIIIEKYSPFNFGYIWMGFNCVSSATYILFMRKRIKSTNFKDFDTVYYNNMLSTPLLVFMSLIVEDWSYANLEKNFPIEVRGILISSMLFSGLSAFAISFASAWCIRVTSSTTYSMVGALNKLPIAASGIIFFGDPTTFGSVSAILIGFFSGILYSIAKNEQNIDKLTIIDNDNNLHKSSSSTLKSHHNINDPIITETLDNSFDMDNNQENFQQMNAATFLPLMLQAQDLVTKLESRVIELENDLETINESHEQERDQLLQEIGEKDEYIHNLKTKVSRLEFEDIPDLDDYDLDGNEDIAEFNISEDEGANDFASKFRLTPRKSIDSLHDEEERRHLEAAYSMSNGNENANFVEEPEDMDNRHHSDVDNEIGNSSEEEDSGNEEDDDHENVNIHNQLPPQGPIPNISYTDNSCPNCNVLLAQVDQHLEERAYLKRDLSALAISLSEEQGLRAQIQANKESLEQEIDDWLNAMFEKVNQMVFDEANTREDIELLSREYKGKFENLFKGSNSRQDRLRELKLLLVHLDSTKQRQTGTAIHNGPGALNRNSIARRSVMSNSPVNSPRGSRIFGNFGHMSPSIFSNSSEEYSLTKGKRIYIDGVLFEEFQEYVKSFITSPAPNTSTPTHSFMKRCMVEDIQPCLFEGSTGWKSPFYKRRLLDAIMKNQCEIQAIYYSSSNSVPTTPLSSQFSNNSVNRSNSYHEPPPAPKVKCGLCGHLRSCDFRMRLSGPDAAIPPSTTTMTPSAQSSRFSINSNPGWIPLDRFCRDRVVAVCDFYSYLSHLRQGLLNNSPVWGMYKQCLKYRRRMGMSRVGSVSMFEEEENIANELLNNSEIEAMVVLVH
ncbi:20097_t:CDS:10 [Entrophospora sp. SA101]|nr:20097_t:CDS:10 [Entrophospora sp. SA101]CAJ0917142.1 8226_t:CDS:10 [Entrophospora sp. SA101]